MQHLINSINEQMAELYGNFCLKTIHPTPTYIDVGWELNINNKEVVYYSGKDYRFLDYSTKHESDCGNYTMFMLDDGRVVVFNNDKQCDEL